jgi:large subunit ribosomal protein L24
MKKIKKGDEVIVLVGKSKGHRGLVTRVLDDDRVIVENGNMVKRHTRGNPQRNEPGGVIEKEAPIHISNVALYNSAEKKGDKVGIRTLEDGRKVRFFKSNGEVVDA